LSAFGANHQLTVLNNISPSLKTFKIMIFSANSAGIFSRYEQTPRDILFSNSYLIRQIMRITLIIALILSTTLNLLFATSATGQANLQTKIKIGLNKESLKSAFKKIEQTTNFRFVYRSEEISSYYTEALPNEERSIDATLHLLLDNNGLIFKLVNNNILITKKQVSQPQSEISEESLAKFRVSGVVTDETGQPLAGVTIKLKNDKRISIATDLSGNFNIEASNDNDVLIISFIGYKTQEISIKNIAKGVHIMMQSTVGSLNEVQIIGYGTTTRALNTGSVSSITAKDIGNQPVSNPLAAMQGKLPGVQITQNNGLPGAG
jgi:hypothetical protein